MGRVGPRAAHGAARLARPPWFPLVAAKRPPPGPGGRRQPATRGDKAPCLRSGWGAPPGPRDHAPIRALTAGGVRRRHTIRPPGAHPRDEQTGHWGAISAPLASQVIRGLRRSGRGAWRAACLPTARILTPPLRPAPASFRPSLRPARTIAPRRPHGADLARSAPRADRVPRATSARGGTRSGAGLTQDRRSASGWGTGTRAPAPACGRGGAPGQTADPRADATDGVK